MPYRAARKRAVQQYKGAYHLLNVTFPLVRDPKLLMGVINNISLSFEYGMDAILTYERQLHLVPNYVNDFQSKFNLFLFKSVKRNRIPSELVNLMMELKELLKLHKKCPTEFQRGNKYILATKDYQLKVLSIKEIKGYLEQNKQFLEIVDRTLKI